MANWDLGEAGWRAEFNRRLTAYYGAVAARLADPEGFAEVFRLAESRRRRVFSTDLSEKRPLLFAATNIARAAPHLEMQADASVVDAA